MILSENRLTVFDADTQETSYGICFFDRLPYIFDTHRRGARYVATLELLTEVVQPVRVSRNHVERFGRDAREAGLLPIPYTACFFKGNLHVYAFSAPVRSYVEKWLKCELWLYSSVIQRHSNELHSYKAVVLQTLRTTSLDDMLAICRTTRPDLVDLWSKPEARAKLQREIEKAIEAVEAA